jgi:hypothetical protein
MQSDPAFVMNFASVREDFGEVRATSALAETTLTDNKSATELLAQFGMFSESDEIPSHFRLFLSQSDRALKRIREWVAMGRMTKEQEQELQELLVEIGAQIICHRIISNNDYLRRFARGVTFSQARHEVQQFSIFAQNFNVAQSQLVVNARTLEAYWERLKLLLNEMGIPFKNGFEGELTGKWSPNHVHSSWLLKMAEGLDLAFEDVGKIWLANSGTKAFVDATFRYYASPDPNVQLGSSFAIENWAANNLWTPWLAGMNKLNATLSNKVNVGYLTYHEAEERHHSQATIDELLENFMNDWFDPSKFLEGAKGILDEGVLPYYVSQLATLPEKKGNDWPETWPETAQPSV